MMRPFILLALLSFLLSACRQADSTTLADLSLATPTTPVEQLTIPATITPTPTLPPTVPITPTATPTPTITPTPTATAVPLTISGDPRASRLTTPVPSGLAACGVIDILDFPMNPPEGANIFGGGGNFARYRNSVSKYHAGEDWWYGSGRNSSFGKLVHSIGHGLVTYAEPEGWNRDKGVIIIQHTFADGRAILSFYGHLDPPSVTLEAGQCVTRGQEIAQIGRPRSSPHLHFEIRTQSPYTPLTGYWPDHPTTAGWLPPSSTIWEQRLATSPGVQWLRPPTDTIGSKATGILNNETLITLEGSTIVAINLADGRERWRYNEGSLITNAILDAQQPLLYLSRHSGQLEALSLLDAQGETAAPPTFAAVWEMELDMGLGTPTLISFPSGGVVVVAREWLSLINDAGEARWTERAAVQPFAWAASGDQLFLSTVGVNTLWQLDQSGTRPWNAPSEGYPLLAADQRWLYGRDGLYRLDEATQTAVLHYPFPPGSLTQGAAIALSDGSLLVAHSDRFDKRLLAFNPDGSLRWERSYRDLISGRVRLLTIGQALYLIAE
jgi:murein DD-endopeptidase MepM/ murein hydrolase activator NlpD